MAVTVSLVVEDLIVIEDVGSGHIPRFRDALADLLLFQTAEKTTRPIVYPNNCPVCFYLALGYGLKKAKEFVTILGETLAGRSYGSLNAADKSPGCRPFTSAIPAEAGL